MGIFDIFKKSKTADKSTTFYYHEDFYRQIEIVSQEDLQALEKQSKNIYGFTKKNDGQGFAECYVRNSATDLDEYEIKSDELEMILKKFAFIRADKVTTGYSSHVELKKDVKGYGTINGGAIFFEDFNGIVGNIWLTNLFRFDQDILADALHEVGSRWNLILMDWNKLLITNLSDRLAISQYLKDEENW